MPRSASGCPEVQYDTVAVTPGSSAIAFTRAVAAAASLGLVDVAGSRDCDGDRRVDDPEGLLGESEGLGGFAIGVVVASGVQGAERARSKDPEDHQGNDVTREDCPLPADDAVAECDERTPFRLGDGVSWHVVSVPLGGDLNTVHIGRVEENLNIVKIIGYSGVVVAQVPDQTSDVPRAADPKTGYHHGDLEVALVAEALQLVRERGADAVSLRQVAHAVGVSPSAAYAHFPDKQALMGAVSARGMEILDERMLAGAAAVTGTDDRAAIERFWRTGEAYVRFATEEPHLFRHTFGPYCLMNKQSCADVTVGLEHQGGVGVLSTALRRPGRLGTPRVAPPGCSRGARRGDLDDRPRLLLAGARRDCSRSRFVTSCCPRSPD